MSEAPEIKTLKKNILNLMNNAGLSMRELSLSIDASPCYIQKVTGNKYDPSISKLYAIASFFDVPVASLFIEDNSIIQEIDTYLITLDSTHQEIILNLTKQLANTSKPNHKSEE